MAERIDDRLLYQILKGLQARVTMLEAMLGEIRDGFASIRAQRSTVEAEASALERRVDELERSLERVHRRLLADERDRL
jgi:septal ring factor EnvC (AmiA/AmiB activator)